MPRRWDDERYVRVYTRDTAEWVCLPWESRCLWWELLRHVDRVGVLHVGKSPSKSIAALTRAPVEVVERALSDWLADGCAVLSGETLLVPNFYEAQEAKQTDAARQRASRERAAARAKMEAIGVTTRDTDLTNRDGASRNVTEPSRAVTHSHSVPSRAVPSRAVPGSAEGGSAPAAEAAPRRSRPKPLTDQKLLELVKLYESRRHPSLKAATSPPNLSGPMASHLREIPLEGPDSWASRIDRMNASAFCRGERGDRGPMGIAFLLRHPGDIANGEYDDGGRRQSPQRSAEDEGLFRARIP